MKPARSLAEVIFAMILVAIGAAAFPMQTDAQDQSWLVVRAGLQRDLRHASDGSERFTAEAHCADGEEVVCVLELAGGVLSKG